MERRRICRRVGSMVGAVAACAAGLATVAGPVAASPPVSVLSPSVSTVGRGDTVTVGVSGCTSPPPGPAGSDLIYRFADVSLITQTPGGEVLAAGFSPSEGGADVLLAVPGWVDPADPAVIAGACQQYVHNSEGVTQSTLFTYDDVAIDITDGSASALTPAFTLHRTIAAGGQVLSLTGSGCAVGSYASVAVYEGTDRSGRTSPRFVGGVVDADVIGSTFELEVALLRSGDFDEVLGEVIDGGPLAEGSYTVIMACVSDVDEDTYRVDVAESQVIEVVGSYPSNQISLTQADDDSLVLNGSGCTGGQTVRATFTSFTGGFIGGFLAASQKSRAIGSLAQRGQREPEGQLEQVIEVTPNADGEWSIPWTPPGSGYEMQVSTDCGDPKANGFRYLERQWFETNWADLYISRLSPATAPAGTTVAIHAQGECDENAKASVLDRNRTTISEAPLTGPNSYGMFSGSVTAPSSPGTYFLAANCGKKQGFPQDFKVFAPNPVAEPSALPAGSQLGWPKRGGRAMYEGRIGPISLPAEDMGASTTARALGPSGFFIDVPRPAGDFAITKISFDLVDAEGMPVPQTDAHLHHFVITNKSSKNPACPGSTFGLPGQIVGAAGAERSVLDFGTSPYGVMVKGSDAWTGVYNLMNMSGANQTVFLTYDIEYRRDVENVRPVTTYFGSATGCSTFTWTIDGSGSPDVQSTLVEMTKPGRLIGTGGHIHNGGLYTSLTDDRGRQLCRSALSFGAGSVGHDHGASRIDPGNVTTTTVIGGPSNADYPPEFYEDDPPIAGLKGCQVAESVKAGQLLRFDAVYDNLRPRSGVMGIFTMYVWEGGGPADPVTPPVRPGAPADPATAIPGNPNYAG